MKTWTLAALIHPVTPEQFFAEYFDRKPLVVRRSDRGYFGDLVTLADIDHVMTELGMRHPDVSLADSNTDRAVADYTYREGTVDPIRALQAFVDGATIIVNQSQHYMAGMAELCRALERDLTHRLQANLYVTPANAQGFKIHYDNHDVFVLQALGSKDWRIYDTPVELPLRGQHFNPHDFPPGEVSQEFTLDQGDLCYIPRGVMHDARARDEISIHVTAGIMAQSWTDFLLEAISWLGVSDPTYRRTLPPGFAGQGFDAGPARAEFLALVDRMSMALREPKVFDRTLGHFVGDFVETRMPRVSGQLMQLVRAADLRLDDRLAARPSLIWRIEKGKEDKIHVVSQGIDVAFPDWCRPAVERALTGEPFTPAELPPADMDEDGRRVIVARLVREALVRFVED